jgi:hypothetical protein
MNDDNIVIANLREINDRLRAENAELIDVSARLRLDNAKTSLELDNTKRANEDIANKLARVEERHHAVCMKLDENERTIFQYRTALDVFFERLVNYDNRPVIDEIGL